jgi:hypothetical protein
LDHDETIDAVRRTISRISLTSTVMNMGAPPAPLSEVTRDEGLPESTLLPHFLWREGDQHVRRGAMHEAGHIAVALGLGLEVVRAIRRPTVIRPEYTEDGYSCEVGFHDLRDVRLVMPAGLLTEIMVWGDSVNWIGALNDFSWMHQVKRMGEMSPRHYKAAVLWSRTGLPTPTPLRLKPTVDDIEHVRDTLSNEAIRMAIDAFPTALAIGELLDRRWAAGETFVSGEGIIEASRDPFPLSQPIPVSP